MDIVFRLKQSVELSREMFSLGELFRFFQIKPDSLIRLEFGSNIC